jgi:hypothetical protein
MGTRAQGKILDIEKAGFGCKHDVVMHRFGESAQEA